MRYLTLVAGVALAVGVIGCKDDGKTVGEKVGDATDKAVDATKDAGKAVVAAVSASGDDKPEGMRGAMEGIVQNALDKNDFKEMTNHLTEADRKRLDAAAPDPAALNAEIDTFKKNWKDKYGGDIFKVMDAEKAYSADFVKLSSTGDAGSKMGTATIVASHGMPEVQVPFVGEGGKWRLDLPDDMTASQVNDALKSCVSELNGMKADWPATDTEGYRVVTHHLMMKLLGK